MKRFRRVRRDSLRHLRHGAETPEENVVLSAVSASGLLFSIGFIFSHNIDLERLVFCFYRIS
jgi:hypothetical protein